MSENLTIKILEVTGLAIAAQYVGLPVGKIRPRDSVLTSSGVLTQESLRRLNRLIAKGDGHAKVMRQVVVHMEITAPRYWLQQLATYRSGLEMYSASTMYMLLKNPPGLNGFVPGTECSLSLIDALGAQDLARAKANLPEGFLQTRLVMCSYQVLRRMWLQRHAHELGEWAEFMAAIHKLPYRDELIFVEPRNPWRVLWQSLLDDVGILEDDKPDTLNVIGLTGDQCDEYTTAVLELLHKESAMNTKATKTAPSPGSWCALWLSVHANPHVWSGDSKPDQDNHCFFCDHPDPGHTQDCLYLRAASTSILFSNDDTWRALWQELIVKGPWDKTGFCHYCGVPAPRAHDPECPYLRATTLENETTTKESK